MKFSKAKENSRLSKESFLHLKIFEFLKDFSKIEINENSGIKEFKSRRDSEKHQLKIFLQIKRLLIEKNQ